MRNIANRISIVFYVVAILFTGLTAWGFMDFVFPAPPPKRVAGLFANPLPKIKQKTGRKVDLSEYDTIRADRFSGFTAQGEPIKKMPGKGKEAVFRLRGTAIHSNPALSSAFLEVPGVDGQKAYYPGEKVHSAELIRIDQDYVELKVGDKTVKLEVFEDEEPAPRGQHKPGHRPPGALAMPKWMQKLPPEVKKYWDMVPPDKKAEFLKLPKEQQRELMKKAIKKLKQGGK